MKTPFDTALRLRRRQIDRTRIAIHAETVRLMEIDDANEALQRELAEEYEVSAGHWVHSTEAFIRRKLSQRARLMAHRLTVSQEIDQLRRQATEAYGAMQVMEQAAEGFRADQRRNQQRAEQRVCDDLGAARIARTLTPVSRFTPAKAMPATAPLSAPSEPAVLRLPAR